VTGLTPSQTVGPFFHYALPWFDGPHAAPADDEAIWLRGRVTDGAGEPVTDALVETWQAAPDGSFDHAEDPGEFRGFARCSTDGDGAYAIRTRKPGAVAEHAPHVTMSVFARGLLNRVVTRVYFPEEGDRNDRDPVLAAVTEPSARATLLADATADGYRFDIRLQGEHETVFFDI
jgi:protocatechuate 3,4-dioxygenase, alpha subunit